jgi:hypothetical protein
VESNDLGRRVYLTGQATSQEQSPQPQSAETERAWERIKDATYAAALEAFVTRCKDTFYVATVTPNSPGAEAGIQDGGPHLAFRWQGGDVYAQAAAVGHANACWEGS